MSRRKQKNSKRGQPGELLDELNALHDLLGSDEIGDIPLLDRVAAPGKPVAAAPPKPKPPREPLEEIDPPVLFSPVDEEPPEDYPAELSESDRELLRPLQDLPGGGQPEAAAPQAEERQRELFDQPSTIPAKENPFLPAHIRARLTGGRGPGAGERDPEERETRERETETQETAEQPAAEAPEAAAETEAEAADNTSTDTSTDKAAAERERQRRQLIDRLVAKQLPELERQLRARIERMVDELETKR